MGPSLSKIIHTKSFNSSKVLKDNMNLQSLLEKPRDKSLLISFFLTFIMTFVFLLFIFAPLLAQFPPGAGLMEMKAAWNKKNMDRIIDKWNKKNLSYYVELMTIVNLIDFLFMAVYGMALFTGLLLVARKLEDSKNLQNFYFKLSLISWFSVIFDIIEGIFIAIILLDPMNITDFVAFGTSLSATLCIIVLYSCVFLWIIGLIIVLFQRIRSKI